MGGLLLGLSVYPIVGGLAVYGIGRKNKNIRDYAADFVTITEFLVFASLLIYYISMAGDGNFLYLAGAPAQEKGSIVHTHAIMEWTFPVFGGLGFSFTLDGFRLLYGTVASFMWMMTTIFSKEYFTHYRNRNRYYLFMLFTLGATVGVFLAGDFYTLFVFFEMMSFTSYVWVAQDERKESLRAAETYLAIAVLGGLVMLMGIFLWYDMTGTLSFDHLFEAAQPYVGSTKLYVAGACMLFGFGAKAGAFPLHVWLPKAHPVAPAPASALLSGILTKSGVLGILIVSCNLFMTDEKWNALILVIGVVTMFGGALLALCSNDLKRTLACSSMSQIGFILVGIGMTGLLRAITGEAEAGIVAVRGTFLHMVNHSLMKLVLFMAAGVVFMNVHKLDLNDVRGFGHKKPLLHAVFLGGALGIGGIPLFNGYISKSLLHEGIVEYMHELHGLAGQTAVSGTTGIWSQVSFGMVEMKVIEWIFLISGGLTLAYMTKLYVCLFIEKNKDAEVQQKFDSMKGQYMNKQSAFALAGSAVILPVLGMLPRMTMDKIADMGSALFHITGSLEVSYFNAENLKGALISICVGAVVYIFIVRTAMVRREGRTTLLERVEMDLEQENVAGNHAAIGKAWESPVRLSGGGKGLFSGDVYVDIWPRWLDLENLVYRPLLTQVLPVIFGMVCRFMDRFVDFIVVLLRKTIYQDSRLPHELPEGNIVTHVIGMFLDGCAEALNKTIRRKHPVIRHHEHRLAILQEELSENNMMIARSLSFGLMLFCIGFLLTVVYLLM